MPVLYHMDFCPAGLAIAYRASPDPQELVIAVDAAGAAGFAMSVASIRSIVEVINRGGAGSNVFPPTSGFAERLAGPWEPTDPAALGPSYRWTLRVAGVAPIFLRNMVEELRRAGANQPVTRMQILGSLPLDRTDMSLREARVLQWVDERQTYPEAWQQRPFAFTTDVRDAVAALRIELAATITPALREELEALSLWWLNACRNYVSEEGMEVVIDPTKTLPTFGSSKTEFRALYEEFFYKRAPSIASLLNMLTRFHAQVAPIARAELLL